MTSYVYRITVDKYPTPDGRPFADQDEDFYIEQVHLFFNPNEGEMADWLPDISEWVYSDEPGEPAKIGRTFYDGEDGSYNDVFGISRGGIPNPLLKVPFTRRKHWFSATTARGIVAGLREWGAEVRLERCPLDGWEAVA